MVFAVLALMAVAIGPFSLRDDESNWDAISRAYLPREVILREFVAGQFEKQEIDGHRVEELLAVNPRCCSIKPIRYNPLNWLGWHLLAGFRGSPAWLVEAEYTYRQGNAYYRYRTFGRLTRGGGYLTEYGNGPGRLVAVERAEGCKIDRLGSGLEMLESEFRETVSSKSASEPAKPVIYVSRRARQPCTNLDGTVTFLSRNREREIEDTLGIIRRECSAEVSAKKRKYHCHDRPVILSSASKEALDRSESLGVY